MNLVLFEPGELGCPLPLDDPRATHLREVLRRKIGEPFDCGLVDGPKGKARIVTEDSAGFHLSFTWEETPPPALAPATLLVGLPRPQTVRKILLEATTLGVARMVFFTAERSEPSYARSTLWRSGEWRKILVAGAEQAFCTRLPRIDVVENLSRAIESAGAAASLIALDNYEAPVPLSACALAGAPIVLAIGAERGWSATERDALRAGGFTLAHLGSRVLRTETACVAATAIVLGRIGLM